MPRTVTLTKPLKGGQVTAFAFREPRLEDYVLLGDPRIAVPSGEEDRVYMRPIPEKVGQYAERLLIDGEAAVLGAVCLRDTLVIQSVILGFFRDAESDPVTEKTNSSESAAS